MGKADRSFSREHQGGSDALLQLADVQGPAMAEQRAACLGRERRPLAAVLAQERRDQEPEVLSPLPQRRQAEGEAGDARIQVGAEALRRHRILQVLVGGRDHAQVHSRRLARTDRQDFAFLHRAQQRGLGR